MRVKIAYTEGGMFPCKAKTFGHDHQILVFRIKAKAKDKQYLAILRDFCIWLLDPRC